MIDISISDEENMLQVTLSVLSIFRRLLRYAFRLVAVVVVFVVLNALVMEGDWQGLASTADDACDGKEMCVVDLAEEYPFDWQDAYVFDRYSGYQDNFGYFEWGLGLHIDLLNMLFRDPAFFDVCQSIIFLDDERQIVFMQQSLCAPRSWVSTVPIRTGYPKAEFDFSECKGGFLHISRREPHMLAFASGYKLKEYRITLNNKNAGCLKP